MSPNCSWPLEHLDQRRIYFYWKQTRNMRKWWRASRIGKSESREKRKQWNKPKCVCFPAWKAIWQKMLRWPVHLHVPILWASDGRLTRSEVITGHPLLADPTVRSQHPLGYHLFCPSFADVCPMLSIESVICPLSRTMDLCQGWH